jgi:hypothetical protein
MNLSFRPTRQQRRRAKAENKRWPEALVRAEMSEIDRAYSGVPRERQPVEVWRSREFLVQVFQEKDGIERLSVLRTEHDGDDFIDGIAWGDLQRLKRECGRGGKDAIEIFPADVDVVNIANIRHLWVLPEPLPMAWRTKG